MKLLTVPGNVSDDHTDPPSVVTMIAGESVGELKSLTASQTDALTHETPVKTPTPAGIVSAVQVPPPSVVPTATGSPKMPNPTAVQSELVAHEIPFSPLT